MDLNRQFLNGLSVIYNFYQAIGLFGYDVSYLTNLVLQKKSFLY